jgi:Flp pilus assembly protein TadD
VGTGAHKNLLLGLLAGALLLCAIASAAQTRKSGTHRRIPSDEAIAARAIAEAEAAMERKEWAAAERELQDVVAKDPKNYRAWFDLGYLFHHTDRRPEALDAYRRSVAAKPDFFESTLNLGLLLAGTEDPEAETFLRAATRLRPAEKPEEGLARAWTFLGDFLKQRSPTEAVAAYAEAAKLAPKDPEPHLAAGALLEEQGKVEAAEAEFLQARQLAPDSEEARNGLLRIYFRSKRWTEAEAMLRKSLEQKSATNLRMQLGRVLLEQGRKDEGMAELEAVARDSSDPAAEGELAALYFEAGQYEPAALHYRKALARDPRNAELHHALGVVLTRQKKYAEAEAALVAAVNADPNRKEAYFDLAFAADRNKDYLTAIRALDARARFFPESPGTYFMRATAYDNLKDFPQAVQNYRQFLLVANGQYPDEEWKARHRLKALESK